jgi:predicted regulator of Ras-like GTPase activity (Roadblock/LC7/MglB family)
VKEILSELNKTSGVLGSAVLAPDGLLIAEQVSTALPSEELWQKALRAFGAFSDIAEGCGCGEATGLTMEWTGGRLMAHSVPGGVLIAATRGRVPLGQVQTAVEHAAARIRETGG